MAYTMRRTCVSSDALGAVQVLPQIEQLARLELDVAVVRRNCHTVRMPLGHSRGPRKSRWRACLGCRAFWSNEHLRDEQNGASGVLALHVEQGADSSSPSWPAATARAGGHVENAWRALQEQ
jgi:hypothetical protein